MATNAVATVNILGLVRNFGDNVRVEHQFIQSAQDDVRHQTIVVKAAVSARVILAVSRCRGLYIRAVSATTCQVYVTLSKESNTSASIALRHGQCIFIIPNSKRLSAHVYSPVGGAVMEFVSFGT
jgi:hypothetical protein